MNPEISVEELREISRQLDRLLEASSQIHQASRALINVLHSVIDRENVKVALPKVDPPGRAN